MVRKHDLGRELPNHEEIQRRIRIRTPPRGATGTGHLHRLPEPEANNGEAVDGGYDPRTLHTTPRARRVNLENVQPRVDSWSFRSKKPQLLPQVHLRY